MTVSNISPIAGSLVTPADSVSFDFTPTGSLVFFQVSYLGTASEVVLLSSTFQPGFEGTQTIDGGVRTVTFSRVGGWDASPFSVKVDWVDDGGSQSATHSYELANENLYPELMQPRNPLALGSMTVTDESALSEDQAGWLEFIGFTVEYLGNGKVRITDIPGSGGGGGGTGDGKPGFGTWLLDNTADTAPTTSGDFSVSSATPGSVLVIRWNDSDNSENREALLAELANYSRITLKMEDGEFAVWHQDAAIFDNTGYWSITVDALIYASSGFALTPGENYSAYSDNQLGDRLGTEDVVGPFTGSSGSVIYDSGIRGRRDNWFGVGEPGANDDELDTYGKGSLWKDLYTNGLWVCIDDTTAGAEWILTTPAVVSDSTEEGYYDPSTATANPPTSDGEIWVNTDTQSTTATMKFHENSRDGTDMDFFWSQVEAGDTLWSFGVWSGPIYYTVDSITDNTTYWTVGVTFVSGGFDDTWSGWTGSDNAWWHFIKAGVEGDVVGPSSAVNETLAIFDGVTGKLIKEATDGYNGSGELVLAEQAHIPAVIMTEQASMGTTASGTLGMWASTDAKVRTMSDAGDLVTLTPHVSTSTPTADDDNTLGFSPGQIWIHSSGSAAYVCISNGTAAADWNLIG